jgi:hypothetical protein
MVKSEFVRGVSMVIIKVIRVQKSAQSSILLVHILRAVQGSRCGAGTGSTTALIIAPTCGVWSILRVKECIFIDALLLRKRESRPFISFYPLVNILSNLDQLDDIKSDPEISGNVPPRVCVYDLSKRFFAH